MACMEERVRIAAGRWAEYAPVARALDALESFSDGASAMLDGSMGASWRTAQCMRLLR